MKPKVMIALGKDICNYLLNVDVVMRKLRGKIYDYMNTKLVCSYHTSYLARGGGSKHPDFEKVVDDFKKAINLI
jgi:uracil-DNA glycosylase